MKKITSALLVCVLLVGVIFSLVACANTLSGTYEGTLCDLKFKGNKVTVILTEDSTLDGTYEIEEKDDGKMTITFDFVDEDKATDDEKRILTIIDAILDEDLSFEKGEDSIKISIFTFKKK